MTEQDAAFERCVDFLIRMINKYGKEFLEDIEGKETNKACVRSEKTEKTI